MLGRGWAWDGRKRTFLSASGCLFLALHSPGMPWDPIYFRLLELHLDLKAAEQIRRHFSTPETLVLTSDQSPLEIKIGSPTSTQAPLLKSTLAMSPWQWKKVSRTTPTMKNSRAQ
uniref:Protein phosphatase 1 regulatory subunit 1A n=1 Tax=Ursus maritimus TaxID=29073 RepID=A0A452SXG1_URSMA